MVKVQQQCVQKKIVKTGKNSRKRRKSAQDKPILQNLAVSPVNSPKTTSPKIAVPLLKNNKKPNPGKEVHRKIVKQTAADKHKQIHLEVDGFKEWKCRETSTATHQFFIKAHQNVRETDAPKKPTGKTLLVINIPSFITQQNLKDLFSSFGPIVEVFIHQNPTSALPAQDDPYFPQSKNQIYGYKVAYIVFRSPQSIINILRPKNAIEEPLVLSSCSQIESGLRKWIGEYNQRIVESSFLEDNVKKFMDNFDREQLKRKREAEVNDEEPDEDGWITVTRSGPRPGLRRTEQLEEKLKEKKRKSEKQLMNFTPTQIKETRAKQLADLKKKFDEDKQRVAMMKQQRKFRPFGH